MMEGRGMLLSHLARVSRIKDFDVAIDVDVDVDIDVDATWWKCWVGVVSCQFSCLGLRWTR